MTDVGNRPIPPWFDEAKFGVMIVWTPAAVPAFAPLLPWNFEVAGWGEPESKRDMGSWYGKLPFAEMYQHSLQFSGSPTANYHAEHFGDRSYDLFGAEFRVATERWDPQPWAELLARAGFKYVVLVVKHQDGFLLWPSATPNPRKAQWQAERDVVGELAAAVREQGLRFGVLYTGGTDFTFLETNEERQRLAIPLTPEYASYVNAHYRELVERYEPSILWNDMGYPALAEPIEFIEWYRRRVPDGITNDRFRPALKPDEPEYLAYADFRVLEYQRSYDRDAPIEYKWESTRGIGASFGYNRQETDERYASSTVLLQELIDCVARGGNLLLAVGPTALGNIPWAQTKRLLEIGAWLGENGSAIYGTRPWTRAAGVTKDGLSVRYTQSTDAVHAIVLGTPQAAAVELDIALKAGAQVALEAGRIPLRWQAVPHGVRVELPAILDEQPAFSLRLSPPSAVAAHLG